MEQRKPRENGPRRNGPRKMDQEEMDQELKKNSKNVLSQLTV